MVQHMIHTSKRVVSFIGITVLVFLSLHCMTDVPHARKPHHTQEGFTNMHMYERPDFWDYLRWRVGRMRKNVPGPDDYNFTQGNNDPAFLKANGSRTTLTWIGHATVLLQLDGQNILTDPHFSERASPVQWAGPRRVIQPGLSIEDLPPIDMVLISHNHYDSLDADTIENLLRRKGGEKTIFFVPLGLKNWFESHGAARVIELDWWEQRRENGLNIIALPVQHWSKRALFAKNDTLWAGWAVTSDHFRFFFCGDSGYAPAFKEIGTKRGPFDLAAIPIGAYEPRWFMKYHHVSPEEALQIHQDIQSKKSVAIHWGTFILTDEPLDEPPVRLRKALEENNISLDTFLVLKHGETIFLDQH